MGRESQHNPEKQRPLYKNKTEYFSSLAMRLFSKMKQDIKFGKLTRRDSEGKRLPKDDRENWGRVVEHCLVEAAAAEALGNALKLDLDDINELVTASAVHDWDKRIEIKPKQFTPEEIQEAQEAFQQFKVSPEMIEATKPEFVERSLIKGGVSRLQKLHHYIDGITDESDLTSYKTRLEKAATRTTFLTDDPELTEKLTPILGPNKNYWDGEKEVMRREQEEIFNQLLDQGYKLTSPDEVPAFIKAQIEKNYK